MASQPKRFLRVYMDLNNRCNLKCRMCYFSLERLKQEPVVTMGLELFQKIAAEVFPLACSVNLSCAAEPLLVPDFPAFLKITQGYSIPETLIVTNATLLNSRMITALIESNLSQIDVSIDGATKKTYEGIRGGSNFERLLENIRLLQATKRRLGRNNPALYLDYTLMKSTISEFPEFLKLAKQLGADSVRANHLIPFPSLNIMGESLANYPQQCNQILDQARALIQELKLNARIPPNFTLRQDNQPQQPSFNKPACRVPYESLYIISDGRVIPCTWFSIKEWCAGNFLHQDFPAIWNGPIYQRLREQFAGLTYTEYCRNCPVYGDESIERYLFRERERKDITNISAAKV